jgi:hypothetical protein
MRTKDKSIVPAMLLGVAVVVSGSASAENLGVRLPICPTCVGYSNRYATSGHRSQALRYLQRKLPLNGFGSVGGTRGAVLSAPGRPFETDPDPKIRFEMNRDDFDRRHGV